MSLNERKGRQIMYSNEQEKSKQSWGKQAYSQDLSTQPDNTEINEEALENITGGMDPAIYHYAGKASGSRVALITHDPSLPLHAEVMGKQQNGTQWQHTAITRPDGQVEHHYQKINDLPPLPPTLKRRRLS